MASAKKSFIMEHLRKAHMIELLAKGRRLDGRELLDYRPIDIKCNIIQKANGSAQVSLGNTQVIAGVKIEVGAPFPDTPDKGLLVVNAEILPLASPYAEPGPPDEEAIELSRVVDRGVRESGMIDLSKLVLIPGQKVRAVFVDVSVLNVDGNLIDATSYAVVSALMTTKMPELEVSGSGEIREKGGLIPLPVSNIPVSVTFARIGESLVVDPDSEEESVMDARITLTTIDDGHLCAGQKGLPGGLTYEQIMFAAETAKIKGRQIREIIKKSVSSVG